MDKITERTINKKNATITREQTERRRTEKGHCYTVKVTARTPHSEDNNPETTWKVTIGAGQVIYYTRARKRAGYANDDMMLNRAINEAWLDFQTTQA